MLCAGFVLSHAAAATALAALAVVLGRRLAAWGSPEARDGSWGLPLALGLGAIAIGASLLGAVGLLTGSGLLVLLGGVAAAAGPEWRPLAGAAASLGRGLFLGPRRLWAWAALATLSCCALLALYPPTGFDALLYHFPAAKRFAASGRISFAPELRFPAFPWMNEVLFAAAMRLQDDVAAQCLQCVVHAGTAALLWEGCRRRFGGQAGALAAGLWLGDPLAAWLAASAYVEPLLAFFLLATVEALDAARRLRAPRCLLLAGGLAGCAAATKYYGLIAVALVALRPPLGAPDGVEDAPSASPAGAPGAAAAGGDAPAAAAKLGRRLRAALPPLAVAAAVALPWYAWIASTTGDPLFPLLARLAHPRPAGAVFAWLGSDPLVPPWRALRQAFWPYPPGSPLLWLLLPVPLLAWRRWPAAGRLAGLALVCGGIIAAVRPDARLVSIVAPLASMAIAGAIALGSAARWSPAAAAPRLLALALVALLPAWGHTLLLVARRGPLPCDGAAREAYLRRQLPGYAALSWLNSNRGRHYRVYGLWAENLRYYAAGGFAGDWYGPARFGDALALADRPAALHAHLAGLGVDYLLVRNVPGRPAAMAWEGPAGAALFRVVYRDREAVVWALAGGATGRGAPPPRGPW